MGTCACNVTPHHFPCLSLAFVEPWLSPWLFRADFLRRRPASCASMFAESDPTCTCPVEIKINGGGNKTLRETVLSLAGTSAHLHESLSDATSNSSTCHLATIFHVLCLSQISPAAIAIQVDFLMINSPKLLLLQFANRSMRMSGSSEKVK